MNRSRTFGLLIVTVGLLPSAAAAQVSAEPWFRGGTFMLTVEAGGAAFSDFDRSQVRPVTGDPAGGDYGRRVSARTSGSVGAWASYWIGDGWGIRAGLAWVPSSFDVWNEEEIQRLLEADPLDASERSHSSLDMWMADVSVLFRFPRSFGRVVPYGIVGGGLIRYRTSGDASLPPEAQENFSDGQWQTAAALVGLGATIPLQRRNLLLSFELTDHISRTPVSGTTRGELFEMSGVQLILDPDDADGSPDVSLTSHVRLTVGLTLPLR